MSTGAPFPLMISEGEWAYCRRRGWAVSGALFAAKDASLSAPFPALLIGPVFILNPADSYPQLAPEEGPSLMLMGCPVFPHDIGETMGGLATGQGVPFWTLIEAKEPPYIATFQTLLIGPDIIQNFARLIFVVPVGRMPSSVRLADHSALRAGAGGFLPAGLLPSRARVDQDSARRVGFPSGISGSARPGGS